MRQAAATLFAITLCASSAFAAGDGWDLAKDEDGIKVWLRDVAGSDMQEYRGVTDAKCRLASLVAMLKDPAGYPDWLHNATRGEMVKTESESIAYPHVYFGMPWPTDDRDMVFKAEVSQDPQTLAVRVKMTATPDLVPEVPDYVRIPVSSGGYLFTPKEGGKVEIDYQLHVEPGGSLPGWLVNALAVDTPFNSLKHMRDLAAGTKYKDAIVAGIQEPRSNGPSPE